MLIGTESAREQNQSTEQNSLDQSEDRFYLLSGGAFCSLTPYSQNLGFNTQFSIFTSFSRKAVGWKLTVDILLIDKNLRKIYSKMNLLSISSAGFWTISSSTLILKNNWELEIYLFLLFSPSDRYLRYPHSVWKLFIRRWLSWVNRNRKNRKLKNQRSRRKSQ